MTEIKDAEYKAVDTVIKRHIHAVRREGTISFDCYSATEPPIRILKINYLIPVDVTSAKRNFLSPMEPARPGRAVGSYQ